MSLECARFKPECINISSGVNYTNKKYFIYKFFKRKIQVRGSIESMGGVTLWGFN